MSKVTTAVAFLLTILRAVTFLGAALFALISVIVALPTRQLFEPSWLVAAVISAALYVLTTWLFVKVCNHQLVV